MALQPGTTLGPYEILELAGAGGMGEVYKARDTRLDRTVAIKVLPAHASGISDLKQRFEREAQTIGSLKHPNICMLHDIGSEAGVEFIVMEYLQGETLADRIARERGRKSGATAAGATPASGSSGAKSASQTAGSQTEAAGRPLKLDEALGIAIQIADALDQAHQHGVIHRDLKPANVMLLASSGGSGSAAQVKLLDFGLAKLTKPADSIESQETVHSDLTGPGMVLGTVRYMAPEQVEGRAVDARTDIFAFGAVLYEMLTGRKAFDGKTQASLIAAIMNVEPTPVSALAPIAPRALDRLVLRCLAKDPDDRWQTAHDLLLQLRWIAGRGTKSGAAATGARTRREPLTLVALAAAVLITAGMAYPAYRYMQGPAEPDDFRFRIPAVGLSAADMAISPDGTTIAMVARPGAGVGGAVRAAGRRRHISKTCGHRQRVASLLVARQPLDWFRRRRAAEESRGRRHTATRARRRGGIVLRRHLGHRRHDPVWHARRHPPRLRRRRRHRNDHDRRKTRNGALLAVAAARRQTLPVSVVEHARPTSARCLSARSARKTRRDCWPPTRMRSTHLVIVLFRRDATVLAQPFDAASLALSGGPVQIAGDVGFNLATGAGITASPKPAR